MKLSVTRIERIFLSKHNLLSTMGIRNATNVPPITDGEQGSKMFYQALVYKKIIIRPSAEWGGRGSLKGLITIVGRQLDRGGIINIGIYG